MREALEDDVEEDGGPRCTQEAQGDVVNHLQTCSWRRKLLVEQNEGNLDGPERRDVENGALADVSEDKSTSWVEGIPGTIICCCSGQPSSIKNTTMLTHLHDLDKVFRARVGNVGHAQVPHVLLDDEIANEAARSQNDEAIINSQRAKLANTHP